LVAGSGILHLVFVISTLVPALSDRWGDDHKSDKAGY
jgi:hypothetical protein